MELIDRDILLEQMKSRKNYIGRPSDPVCLVEDAPAVDAVPVVRCKDCKHYDAHYYDNQGTCYLDGWGVHADFFCANGERREDNDEA